MLGILSSFTLYHSANKNKAANSFPPCKQGAEKMPQTFKVIVLGWCVWKIVLQALIYKLKEARERLSTNRESLAPIS